MHPTLLAPLASLPLKGREIFFDRTYLIFPSPSVGRVAMQRIAGWGAGTAFL